jgi:hypothetical protein
VASLCSEKRWRSAARFRNIAATSSVLQLPGRTQITFGGGASKHAQAVEILVLRDEQTFALLRKLPDGHVGKASGAELPDVQRLRKTSWSSRHSSSSKSRRTACQAAGIPSVRRSRSAA